MRTRPSRIRSTHARRGVHRQAPCRSVSPSNFSEASSIVFLNPASKVPIVPNIIPTHSCSPLLLVDETGLAASAAPDQKLFATGVVAFLGGGHWDTFKQPWKNLLDRFGQLRPNGAARKGSKAPDGIWPAFADLLIEHRAFPYIHKSVWTPDRRKRTDGYVEELKEARAKAFRGRTDVPTTENYVWLQQVLTMLGGLFVVLLNRGLLVKTVDLHIDKKSLGERARGLLANGIRRYLGGDIRRLLSEETPAPRREHAKSMAFLYQVDESSVACDLAGRHEAMSVVDHWCALVRKAGSGPPDAKEAIGRLTAVFGPTIIHDTGSLFDRERLNVAHATSRG